MIILLYFIDTALQFWVSFQPRSGKSDFNELWHLFRLWWSIVKIYHLQKDSKKLSILAISGEIVLKCQYFYRDITWKFVHEYILQLKFSDIPYGIIISTEYDLRYHHPFTFLGDKTWKSKVLALLLSAFLVATYRVIWVFGLSVVKSRHGYPSCHLVFMKYAVRSFMPQLYTFINVTKFATLNIVQVWNLSSMSSLEKI